MNRTNSIDDYLIDIVIPYITYPFIDIYIYIKKQRMICEFLYDRIFRVCKNKLSQIYNKNKIC